VFCKRDDPESSPMSKRNCSAEQREGREGTEMSGSRSAKEGRKDRRTDKKSTPSVEGQELGTMKLISPKKEVRGGI